MKKPSVLLALGALAVVLSGCGGLSDPKPAPESTVAANEGGAEETTEGSAAEAGFVDGVLSTSDMKIEITEHRIIQVGEAGNEYGEKPVIAFWYQVTNLGAENLDPTTAWVLVMKAYQDNDPNALNELEVASLPDARFLQTQLESIKEGGTVENAVAYSLDDLTTPVDLVAEEMLGDEYGTVTYPLQ